MDEIEIKENHCPMCGATKLRYNKPYALSMVGEVGFPFRCTKCGATGNQIHKTVFIGYDVEDPEDEACTIYKRSASRIYNAGRIHAKHVKCEHIATINEPSLTRKYHVIVFTQKETGYSWTYTTTTSKPSGLDVKEGTYYNLIGETAEDDPGRFTKLSIYTEKVDVMHHTAGDVYMRPAEDEDVEAVHKRNGLDTLLDMS